MIKPLVHMITLEEYLTTGSLGFSNVSPFRVPVISVTVIPLLPSEWLMDDILLAYPGLISEKYPRIQVIAPGVTTCATNAMNSSGMTSMPFDLDSNAERI